MLLDTYAALKRINKYKLKFKSKAWITLGLQKINIFKKQNILGEIGKYYEHMERNQIPYFSKNCSIQSSTGLSLDNDDTIFASIAKTTKKKKKKFINIFQTVFQMNLVVQYFCNLLIKKK